MNKIEMNNEMSTLSISLLDDIHLLRAGKLDYKKAMHINRLSCSAIRALATVIVANNHQDIQKDKLEMRQKELNFKMQKKHV